MQRLYFFVLFFFAIIQINKAQTFVYNNEWINYSNTYYKFKIAKEGVFKITAAQLQAAGLGTTDCSEIVLYRDGKQVPIYTSIISGVFTSADYLLFYGYPNDGKLDTKIYRTPSAQLNDNLSLFSDSASYYLTKNINVTQNLRITDWPNYASSSAQPPLEYYLAEVRKNFTNQINDGYAVKVGELLYSSSFDIGEGYTSQNLTNASAQLNQHFPALHFNAAGPDATLTFGAFGTYFWPRYMETSVNNTILDSAYYSSYAVVNRNFVVPDALFATDVANINFKHISNYNDDGQVVSHVVLNYPSHFNFDNKSFINIKLPAVVGSLYIELENFNGAGSALPILIDYYNNKKYVAEQFSAGKYGFILDPSISTRQVVVTNVDAISTINELKPLQFTNYSAVANQGSYLIITNKKLTLGASNVPQEYADYRSSVAGGSYIAKVIDAEELEDQFAFGVSKHPSSIKNFIKYGKENFSVPLNYVLIAGKGMDYKSYKLNATAPLLNDLNLVPTFGYPASDNMLSSNGPNKWLPTAPIGRLSVVTPAELKNYLEKVKQYELVLNDPNFTQIAKKWQKNIVQVVGNSDAGLQATLDGYINSYTTLAKDSLWGAKVYNFTKTPDAQGKVLNGLDLANLFQEGISLFTYFGHSSATTLQFNLENPNAYNNQGKYPIFLVNGCNSGNFFTYYADRFATNETLSEKYVLTPNRGGIAFIASTHFGVVNYLDAFTRGFTRSFSSRAYNTKLGDVFKEGLRLTDPNGNTGNFYTRMHGEETGLHGDPAIALYQHPLPDYSIEPQNLTFPTNKITTIDGTINTKLKMFNLGKVKLDSLSISVKRTYPDLSEKVVFYKKIKALYYEDSIAINFNIDPLTDKGINKLTFIVESDELIAEMSEINNTIVKEFEITDIGIKPIYPYNYAIINNPAFKLIASTINPVSPIKNYLLQVDTTALFNSPFKIEAPIASVGGIITYTPTFSPVANQVYFWRVAVEPASALDAPIWNEFSFIYMPSSSVGFNQSHFYQQTKSTQTAILTDSASRIFNFGKVVKSLQVTNGLYPVAGTDGLPYTSTYNGNTEIEGNCYYHSLMFSIVNGNNGVLMENQNIGGGLGLGGSLAYCGGRKYTFEFLTSTKAQRDNILNFLNNYVPAGSYVMVRNGTNPYSGSTYAADWLADESINGAGNSLYSYFKNAGFVTLDSFNAPKAFSFLFKKSDPSFVAQYDIASNNSAKSSITAYMPVFAQSGIVESPWFGPAKTWQEAHFNFGSREAVNTDSVKVQLIGLNNAGAEVVLKTYFTKIVDSAINTIDANIYPYLKYKLITQDTIGNTPPILNFWRLNYVPVPEGAVATNLGYSFIDTVAYGVNMNINFPFKNISDYNFDSISVKLKVYDALNNYYEFILPKLKPLAPNDTARINFDFNTINLAGLNRFYFDINPDNAQPEQFHFNNLLYKYLYVIPPTTLAVNCNSFTAQKSNNQVLLKWQNTIPSNISNYIIMYSADGNAYNELTSITAANGSAVNNYQFIANLPSSLNYFKLYQVAIDGRKTQVCNTLKINADNAAPIITVYPNPVTDFCNIQFGTNNLNMASISIANAKGQIVKKLNATPSTNGILKINMQQFVSGTYFITILQNDLKTVQKIIKD